MADDGEFLRRWSRRKAAARQGRTDEEPAAPAAPVPAVGPEPEETEEALLARLELPDPDTLDYSSDFTRFMAPGVPDRLRQRALRRLWRSNPILANRDGLNDYDEDYTDATMAAGIVRTAYRVGRGFVAGEAEPRAEGETEEELAAAEADPEPFTAIEPESEET